MADPFSIVSGACGVFSTGITVCGGIINYCSTLKGADEEVDRIARKAARMQNTMRLLENILQDSNSALIEREHADLLGQLVKAIQAGVDILEDAVKKCWGGLQVQPGKQIQSTSRSTAKMALYPFRRNSLVSLNSVLDSLQLELSTAMSMAQMQITRHSHTTILSQGSATYMKVEEGFASLESRLDSGFSIQLGQRVSSLDARSSPSDDSLHHISSGHCHHVARKDRTTNAWFRISRNLFGYNVSASFEVSMGSHGLKLAPSLSFRTVVPCDAPAFQLIDKIRCLDINYPPELMPGLVDTTIAELRQLYSDGKARPSDLNPKGLLVLHEICGLYWKFLHFPSAVTNYGQLVNLCLGDIASSEAENFGFTPIDYFLGWAQTFYSDFSYTCIPVWDWYDPNPQYQDILRSLLQSGVATSIAASSIIRQRKKKQLVDMLGNNKFLGDQGLDIPDEHSAILHQSKPALELAIASYDEKSEFPLYDLAISWPDGLELFLERGPALYSTDTLYSTLYFAIAENQPSSVQLLFNTKLHFPLQALAISPEFDGEMCDILVTELVKRRRGLRKLANDMLPIEELKRLGVSKDQLPDANSNSIYTALTEIGAAVPDELNPKLKEPWGSERYSVLESTSCLRLMECLHRAGFRSMCRLVHLRIDSIAMVLDRALWLIDMGLDLKPSEGDLPTILELWSSIVSALVKDTFHGYPPTCKRACQKLSKSFENLNVRQREFLRDSMSSNEVDTCSCACSACHGCRSVTITLRELSRKIILRINDFRDTMFGNHTCFRDTVMEYLFRDQDENSGFVLAVLQFLTFEELGLTHTCSSSHDYSYKRGQPVRGNDAAEILEEERLLLKELDVLVSEFQQKYTELRIPLYGFIRSYWADRMREFLFKRERADAQIIQGARKIGVWLDWEPVKGVELFWDRPCQNAPTV